MELKARGGLMNTKDLRLLVTERRSRCEEETIVVLQLDSPSVGPIASVPIVGGYYGFDWDSGKFILHASVPVVVKTEKEELWDLAVGFICRLARERRTCKGKQRKSALSKSASEILERAGYILNEEGYVVGYKGAK